ncbi:hypothetical protein KFE98_11570 [bacterium SCSIO 12741]|nr:hypothetical protein KFE98_11570 [bacterium SCSIO 12741]
MKKIWTIPVLLGALLFALPSYGQYFNQQNAWRKHRHEIMFGAGVANYLGDLGGGAGAGRVWLLDLEMSQFKPAITFGYRYHLSYRMAVRANFTYATISGSDKLTSNPERNYRNLSFTTQIYEGSLLFEYYILRNKVGHLLHIPGAKGMAKLPIDVIVFVGAGFFYYNPKADGTALRPLGTEGQGLPDGPEPYSPFSFSIPFGLKADYVLSQNFKVGLDLSYRFTFTDYLDDASTVYYDNDVLRAEKGDAAADLADRTDGSNPGWSAKGAPRGNPKNKDHFLTATVSLTYNFTKIRKRTKRPGGAHPFIKKRKRRMKF